MLIIIVESHTIILNQISVFNITLVNRPPKLGGLQRQHEQVVIVEVFIIVD